MHSAQEHERAALRGRRVLVVEDEMLLAMELESLLRQQGCEIVGPVSTVERALALLEERPDAALLDLNLKGRSATPVASAMVDRSVPFVILTGYGEVTSGQPEVRNAPRLNKPVNHGELVRTLARLLGSANPA